MRRFPQSDAAPSSAKKIVGSIIGGGILVVAAALTFLLPLRTNLADYNAVSTGRLRFWAIMAGAIGIMLPVAVIRRERLLRRKTLATTIVAAIKSIDDDIVITTTDGVDHKAPCEIVWPTGNEFTWVESSRGTDFDPTVDRVDDQKIDRMDLRRLPRDPNRFRFSVRKKDGDVTLRGSTLLVVRTPSGRFVEVASLDAKHEKTGDGERYVLEILLKIDPSTPPDDRSAK